MEVSPLSIRLLGAFEVRVGGQPMRSVRARSVEWLLALLVLRHGRDVARSWLAGTLWPESREALGLHNLRRNLLDLRQALGAEAARLRTPTRATLGLDLAGAEVDVVSFDAAIAAGDERSLQTAVALYRGPLLEGCVEEWVLSERASREEACLQALESLADRAAARGELAAALGYLAQASALDPLRDSTQRRRMQALAANGDLPAALLTYREHRLRLHRELNVEPDPETTQLFQELRSSAHRTTLRRPPVPAGTPAPDRKARGREPEDQRPDHDAIQNPQSTIQNPAPLPRPLTTLIGREEAVREVVQRLRAARLVTLAGGGGVGKTRLAIEAAAELAAEFPAGAAFIELASLADPALLPAHVAAALGVREAEAEAGAGPSGVEPLMQALIGWLASHPVLLVLDNCEHLIEAAAALVHALLSACPALRILTTSRQRLGLTGEVVWRVPSLPAPDPERLPADEAGAVEAVLSSPAAQLLAERAAAVRAEFRLDSREEAVALARICWRLDGIPLALELAAARVSLLTLPQIAARLDDRFRLLTGGSRAALPRHQTLHALIDWSYDLLLEAERALLRRLSVFAGGWTLEAAEAVCGGEGVRCSVFGVRDEAGFPRTPNTEHRTPNIDVLDLLSGLEEKSLVLAELREGAIRYRLLETLREYAREKLTAFGDQGAVRSRHRDWYLQWAEQAERELSGPQVRRWLERLDREHDNLRAALAWSLADQDAEAALRLAAALAPFWEMRLHLSEGRQALAAALALGEAAAPGLPRARALFAAGLLARRQGDRPATQDAWAAALALYRQLGDRRGIAAVLECQGEIGLRFRQADVPLLRESLAIRRELGDRDGMARSLYLMAEAAENAGSLAEARALYQEGLTLDRERGDPRAIARVLVELGRLAVDRGDQAAARGYLEEGLALQRELGDRYWISDALLHLGWLAWHQGEYEAAEQYWEETRAIDLEKQGYGGLVVVFLARLMAAQGDVAGARAQMEAQIALLPARGLRPADELMTLGDLAFLEGDERAARAWYEASLALCREMPSQGGQLTCLAALWRLARRHGDAAEARSLYGQSLALHETLSNHLLIASSFCNLGEMAVGADDLDAARRFLTESLQQYRAIGYPRAISTCLYAWATLAAARGQRERAARLCGAAAAHQLVVAPSQPPIERAAQEAVVAAVRRSYQDSHPATGPSCGTPSSSGETASGEAAFAAAWAEGRAMSLEEAVEYALGEE